MKIKELLKPLLDLKAYPGLTDFEVQGISCHSRKTGTDHVFVAIQGAQEDGRQFIDEAIARGARVVILEKELPPGRGQAVFIQVPDARQTLAQLACAFYGNPSAKIKVVGVTGTNGKTTITYLLEALLGEAGFHPSVIGTINYRFGKTVLPSKNTTPGPLELQALLADMLRAGSKYCLMEVSSHALHQERTKGIDFHSAIFTNLTQDHLDYHRTLNDYFQCKARLFSGLSPRAWAVLNSDCPYGRKLKKMTRANILTYGLKRGAQVTAEGIVYDPRHTTFTVKGLRAKFDLTTPLIGRHNVLNALACLAWAEAAHLDIAEARKALGNFSFVPGRLERVDADTDFSVFVDYAHTEDALQNVLKTLQQVRHRRIILVFGCGGNRDKAKRPKMGRAATQLSDEVIITSDNPRLEDPQAIIEDIRGGIRKKNYRVVPDRREAIGQALAQAAAGDIVLVAGKGHENYQIFKDQTVPFDDKEVILTCLRSRK